MISVLVTAFLVFARLGALLMSMPVFAGKGVPKHLVVLLAAVLTILVAPGVPLVEEEAPTVPWLLSVVAAEVGLGLSLGLVLSAVFASMSYGCEVMSMQIGLAMASLFDPLQKSTTGALGVLASWLAGLVFLGLGLHLQIIEIVASSFAAIPPGTTGLPEEAAPFIVEAVGVTIHVGFRLAGPLLAMVWLVNVFVAVLAKLAPRMNVFFSVGLTINSVGGIALLAFSLPWIISAHKIEMIKAIERMVQLLGAY